MKALSRIVLTLACFLLASCSGAELLNAGVPQEGYSLVQDIAYGTTDRRQLDIYTPDHAKKAPVLIYFHGGAWKAGDKNMYRFIGQSFAALGYVVVVPNYKLYPNHFFPEFMDDAAAAVAWVHANIAARGGDPENIFISGHSAGAHISALLALDTHYMKQAGVKPQWVRGVIGLAGPYDFLPMDGSDLYSVFKKKDDVATQPIHFARKGAPPMLLLSGDADDLVRPGNSIRLADALKKAGAEVELKFYPGVAHMGIVLALADGFRGKAPVREDMDAFMRAHMKK